MNKISMIAAGLLCVVGVGYSYLTAQGAGDTPTHPVANPYEVNTTPDVRFGAYRPGEVIVKFRTESAINVRSNAKGRFATAGVQSVDAVLSRYGVNEAEALMPLSGAKALPRRVKTFNGHELLTADLSKLYCVKGDAALNVEALVADLNQLPEVEFAEPNYIVYAQAAKEYMTDPLYSQQWGPEAVGLPGLWDMPVTSPKRPKIAILDTGVDISHPDLQANIWTNEAEAKGQDGYDDDGNGLKDDYHGWDFVNQTGIIDDYNGHGTHCAGIAAAVGGNGKGIVGANPDALIIPVTVMQSDGTGDVATIVKGIDYATAVGADVISMSFGGYSRSMAEEQALGRAYHSAVLVASAGNDGLCINPHKCPVNNLNGSPCFPAAFTFVLGVQCDGGFSNYDDDGPIYFNPQFFSEEQMYNYELTAPGTNIMSTYPGGRYKKMNGTSMACPLVAGAVSRLLQCKEYPTKELLFGDLIHSSGSFTNFLSAYQIEDKDRKPTLRLVSWRINDLTDGDGRFDAGEEVELYPIIRNDWGTAQNIKVWAEMGELEGKVLEFSQSYASFNKPLSSYAKAESEAPIKFKIADDVVDGRHIRLVIHAQCDGMEQPTSTEILITAENGIEIGGIIEHDTTLEPGVSYIVTKPLAVPDGVTLTILPGTVLKFSDGTGIECSDVKNIIAVGTPENPIVITKRDSDNKTPIVTFNKGDFYYTRFDKIGFRINYNTNVNLKFEDCLFTEVEYLYPLHYVKDITKCNFTNTIISTGSYFDSDGRFKSINLINLQSHVRIRTSDDIPFNYGWNVINIPYIEDAYNSLRIVTFEQPWYWGTAVESTARKSIHDIETGFGVLKFDLSNMLTQPNPEAHGIVWRVMVNGYDAQDEFDKLPPLGVGKHKFEVWYSKKVDETQTPFIAMGVRPPYTQTAIAEDGSWRTEITQFNNNGVITEVPVSVYTAYLTIKGNMAIDGLNRIYVSDGQDLEFFEIPLENSRFNVEVASAGSMSAGFMGEAGLGKVSLTWDPQDDLIEDIMGYNLYRYTLVEKTDAAGNVTYQSSDTVRINTRLLDETQYVDYDVQPGTTYNYYYKILRTSMTENSPSRVVAVTPLTAQKGDANGSMSVDIADVMTEVSYLTGGNPQPFIFEAADVNSDEVVDILDVVKTVNLTLAQPDGALRMLTGGGTARYWIENGTVWVDTDVPLGGVQLSIEAPRGTRFTPADGLGAMESAGAWVAATDQEVYTFLAYSMSGNTIPAGRHALLTIEGAELTSSDLCNAMFSSPSGEEVVGITASVGSIGIDADAQMLLPTPNPFTESVTIPYVVSKDGSHRVEILFTDLGGAVVTRYQHTAGYGRHTYVWTPRGIAPGMYLVTLTIDGRLMQTAKLIKK